MLASNPAGIWIGGTQPDVITGNVAINGLTGSSPRSGGENVICDAAIGGGLTVTGGTAGAALLVIGGSACGGGNTIAGQLQVQDNANRLDIEANQVAGRMTVQKNTAGTTLSANKVASHALCRQDTPSLAGTGNTIPTGLNAGCPA